MSGYGMRAPDPEPVPLERYRESGGFIVGYDGVPLVGEEVVDKLNELLDEWAITTAIERLGGSKGDISMLITDRFGVAYNRATPQERAPMLRELAAAGPKEKP